MGIRDLLSLSLHETWTIINNFCCFVGIPFTTVIHDCINIVELLCKYEPFLCTDYPIAHQQSRPVAKPPVERRKQSLQERSAASRGYQNIRDNSDMAHLEPERRKHVVTIQSPQHH